MFKKENSYLGLAKKINSDITGCWYLCNTLTIDRSDFISDLFQPTPQEEMSYNMGNHAWLSSNLGGIADNQFRIMVLLFAHEMTKNG